MTADTRQGRDLYDLCGNCGAITPDHHWTCWDRADDDSLAPSPEGAEPGYFRCPACSFDHRGDDSDPGVWAGSLSEMQSEWAKNAPGYDWPTGD